MNVRHSEYDAKRGSICRSIVVINESAGGVASVRGQLSALQVRLHAAGLGVAVHLVAANRVSAVLEKELSSEPTLVIVGGGDGTLRGAVGRLVNTKHVLGILPLGTMNRFARALGIPTAFNAATETLITGKDRNVDLGEVNGQVFLNTCTLGLYPELARTRELRRARHPGWPKLLRWLIDTSVAAGEASGSWRLIRFRLKLVDRVLAERVATLLITNNPYAPPGQSRMLDDGVLAIYIPKASKPLGLLWLTLRAIVWGPEHIELLEVLLVEEMVVTTSPRVPIALDGEVLELRGPLRLRSLHGACRVRTPGAGEQ